jgi:hypothetical protein
VPQILEVEGELVRLVQKDIIEEGRLQDMLPFLENRPPITIGILPKSAIIVHWDESNAKQKRAQFLCELAPGLRSARYNERRYQISIPWTYFLFDYTTASHPTDDQIAWQRTNNRIFWAKEPVKNFDSMLGTALVPNCDQFGGICYGDTGVDARLPIGVQMDRLVHEFYSTTFTHDSGTGSPWQSETNNDNWARWDRESRANPNAWQTMPEWETDEAVGTGRRRPARARFITYKTVREILGTLHDRTQPIQVEGMIPEMVMPFTFGRAEEWLGSLTAVDRHRLLTALTNMQADNPGVVEAPPAVAVGADDLGGEPI